MVRRRGWGPAVSGALMVWVLVATAVPLVAAGSRQNAASGSVNQVVEPRTPESIPPIDPVNLAGGRRLRVAASTTIIGDVLRRLTGDLVELHVLMAVGQDPHAYEPAPRDLTRVEGADLVFVNGFGLEEGLLRTLHAVTRGLVIPVSANIVPLSTAPDAYDNHDDHDDHDDADHHDADDHHHEVDPHVWFSVANVISWVDVMVAVLSAADPANAEQYAANAADYTAQLRALDAETRLILGPIPRERRILVTGHGIFGYFARDYDFAVMATIVPSASTQSDASARRIVELVELIRDRRVPAIFVGSTDPLALQNVARTIAAEAGTPVRVMPTLTGSLTPEQSSYIDYFRFNALQIAEGLR